MPERTSRTGLFGENLKIKYDARKTVVKCTTYGSMDLRGMSNVQHIALHRIEL